MEKKPYVIGLDLGGTNSVFGIVDSKANVVASVSVKTRGHGTAEQYVTDCCEALQPIITQVGGIDKIQAMGIGAPNGNYYTGSVENAPNLEWPGIVPLAKMFSEKLGVPVALTNDANAAAIGEMAYGAARGMKHFIMMTLGTGLGSGIVVNGQLVYGCDGFAGELGHVVVDRSEHARDCGCGRKGCLEAYCSATGMARTAREWLAIRTTPSTLRDIPAEQIESKDISIAASQGDKLAKEIMNYSGELLGKACADFVNFSSPQAIIFFGGPTKAGDLLMNPVRKAFEENLLSNFKGKCKLLLSELDGASAAVLGASALGWEL